MSNKFKNIINVIGFYICWWSCILGPSKEMSYLGPIVTLIFLFVHFYLFVSDIKEFYLILIIGVIGTVVDSLLFLSGFFVYAGSYIDGLSVAPLWITAMWVAFAATVNHSMSLFKGRWVLMVLSGVVFGPAAYYTGQKFEAINFQLSIFESVIILGIVWGIAMPLLFIINNYLGLDD